MSEVLPSIKAVLDAAASHHLTSHARRVPARPRCPCAGGIRADDGAGEGALSGHPALDRGDPAHAGPSVAVNELGFKREEIGVDQIEAKVRLTLWHRPAKARPAPPADPGGRSSHEPPSPVPRLAAGGIAAYWRCLATRRRPTRRLATSSSRPPAPRCRCRATPPAAGRKVREQRSGRRQGPGDARGGGPDPARQLIPVPALTRRRVVTCSPR
jgi:hypothetical protein